MFPHYMDSSMLSTFRSCPQKFFRSYIQHWKPQAESVHLVAGGAFAKGIEVARRAFFEEGLLKEAAEAEGLAALMRAYGTFECPPDSAKSLERTAGALEFYYSRYPLGGDGATPITFSSGKRGIEFSFAEPLPIAHPVTGAPLLYTGRSDMIATFAGGTYIFDEKTTSQLGASWPRQWELRSQFTGYAWAAREQGIDVTGAVIRGVSILKTKYDTLQTLTYRPEWETNRWLEQVCRDLTRMIACWEEGYWDWDLDHACAEYGGCQFLDSCKSPDPESWLPVRFEKKVWDPLARRELTVEEHEAKWNQTSAGL